MINDPKFQQSLDIYLQGELDPEKEMKFEERLMTEEGFRSYLLGELKPEEHLFLEGRLWRDSKASEAFEMVEDELIEDYSNAALTEHEMELFERFFVWTQERRQKLGLFVDLNKFAANKKSTERKWRHSWDSFKAYWRFKNPVLSWSLAAALFVIFVGGPWLVLKDLNRQAYPNSVASSLSPELVRGSSDITGIDLTAGTDLLQLELAMVPDDYSRFLIVLEQVDGGEIFSQIFPRTESIVQERTLKLSLSAEPLVDGDYIVKLSGENTSGDFESIENYYFRIIRD